MTLTIPDGISGVALANSRIVVNTTGGKTEYNIQRCTANCLGSSPVFSSIYSSDVTLSVGDRTTTGGTPTSTSANAGDQFRVVFSRVGSGISDVTVSLTYQYTAGH